MHPGVKYELQELEKLAARITHPSRKTGAAVHQTEIISEIARIKNKLIDEILHFEDERHLERYIQYHQQALIGLMDNTATLLAAKVIKQTNQYQTLYNAFEELLVFIERHFAKYFDQDARAPIGYVALAKKETCTKMKRLQEGLANRGADTRIVNVMLHALKQICNEAPEKIITYRKIRYAREMYKELFRVVTREEETANVNDELRQIMYYLNYNSMKVVTYHAHYMSALMEDTEIRSDKIEKLSLILKNINQAQVKPGIGYNLHATSLKNQLNNYVTEEMEYQERLQQLAHHAPNPNGDMMKGFKLKFEASVSQLAYLIKIMVDTKLIINTNLSQVLHFIVRFAITKRAESISYGSLRSKFYNVETGTKQAVRTMLVSLIHHIDNN